MSKNILFVFFFKKRYPSNFKNSNQPIKTFAVWIWLANPRVVRTLKAYQLCVNIVNTEITETPCKRNCCRRCAEINVIKTTTKTLLQHSVVPYSRLGKYLVLKSKYFEPCDNTFSPGLQIFCLYWPGLMMSPDCIYTSVRLYPFIPNRMPAHTIISPAQLII